MGCDKAPVPLRVECLHQCFVISGDVHLKWTTATETNNRGFEIQRSNNGEFATIGFVKGSGTTSEVHSYSFVDKKVEVGKYSYRIKQTDLNGQFSYSNVIEVDIAVH